MSYNRKFKPLATVLKKDKTRKLNSNSKTIRHKLKITLQHYLHMLDQFSKQKPFPIMGLDYNYDALRNSIFSINDDTSFEQICQLINQYSSTAFKFKHMDIKSMDVKRKKKIVVSTKHTELHNIIFGSDNVGLKNSTYNIVILAVSDDEQSTINFKLVQDTLKKIYRRVVDLNVDKFFEVSTTVTEAEESSFDIKSITTLPNLHFTGVSDLSYSTQITKYIANSKSPAYKRIYSFFVYLYLIINMYQYDLVLQYKNQKNSSSGNFSINSIHFTTALVISKKYSKFFDLTILPLQELKYKSKLDIHFI